MLETSARRRGALPSATRSRRTAHRLAGVVMTALAAVGCSHREAAAPRPSPTPLTRLDTTAMQIPRIQFCSLVPDRAVRQALGGRADSTSSYRNGDRVALPGVGTEVVHEIGCGWNRDDGTTARAWVFARPVDAAFAHQAVVASRGAAGCQVSGAPAYGRPSVTQTCPQPGGTTRVRHAGLFGQTWLTCELIAPTGEVSGVRTRADAWCVEVANALDTRG
jgi:hypothetical protein